MHDHVEQFLGFFQGEGRDKQSAVGGFNLVDFGQKGVVGIEIGVEAVAVGRFHDDGIGGVDVFGWVEQVGGGVAEVTTEDDFSNRIGTCGVFDGEDGGA